MRRLIWSPLIRVLHWTLALSVIGSFATHDISQRWHEWLGYVALAAVALRIFIGLLPATDQSPQRYSRFADFILSPTATWRYAKQVLQRREPRYLGHNPLGGYMVVALLWVTLIACISGWLAITDRFFGIAWVGNLHDLSGHAIVVLAVLHVLGVAYTSWHHHENLVAAMLHGHKPDRAAESTPSASETH
jgi:cytochrome b